MQSSTEEQPSNQGNSNNLYPEIPLAYDNVHTWSPSNVDKTLSPSMGRASILVTPRTRRSTTIRSATVEIVPKVYVKSL